MNTRGCVAAWMGKPAQAQPWGPPCMLTTASRGTELKAGILASFTVFGSPSGPACPCLAGPLGLLCSGQCSGGYLTLLCRAQAHMCQGLGQHGLAVQLLTEALEDATTPDATIECLFMRGGRSLTNAAETLRHQCASCCPQQALFRSDLHDLVGRPQGSVVCLPVRP